MNQWMMIAAVGCLSGASAAGVVRGGDDPWAWPREVDVSGAEIFGGLGELGNVDFVTSDGIILEHAELAQIGWDLTFEAFGAPAGTLQGAWLSDLHIRIANGDGDSIDLHPAAGFDTPGYGTFSSKGLVTIRPEDRFYITNDNSLTITLYSTADSVFPTHMLVEQGTIQIGTWVPTPGGLAVFAAAGLVASRRRR